ncbi:hypothetical protein COCOBI_12-3570 [Coccomyxa sp. Obi]|nr:hypothetical protein COCOBI_12-3570 [Coccomyxa sp. Obi]
MAKEAKASKTQNGGDAPAAPASNSEGPKDGEGPVLTVITKRLRAANKKLKRIEEIEGSRAAGKTLNADQEEVLRGKPKVLGTIEELERLAPLLKEALVEERSALEATAQSAAESAARAHAEQEAATKFAALEEAKAAAERSAAAAQAEAEEAKQHVAELQAAPSGEAAESAITRLIQLIYFAMLFVDDGSHQHLSERSACRSYDYDDDEGTPGAALTNEDLTFISQLGQLIIQRPPNQTLCHQDSITHCKELAMKFLDKSEEMLPLLNTTAAHVAERLERVLSLGYITVVPQVVQVPTEPVQQPDVSAATMGNGMYAAHDEPIYTAPDVQPLNSAPLVTGFTSAPADYKDAQANYFHMNQDNSVFAPLLDTRNAPPADNAAHHPSASQAHQIVFMTESKVLDSAPSIDTAPAAVEPIAAPQPSMPQLEMANGYAVQQQQVPNGVPDVRAERGRGGRGGGPYRAGPPREARGGGRGPPRGGGRGPPPGGRGSGDLGTRGSGEPFRGNRGRSGHRGGRGRGPPPGVPQPTYAAL